ncbi:MAG: vapB1 [Polaromonas sp.]|nr:vapB1 [Polaromonas sp.]
MIGTAKVFITGNSQAVRLPKAFRVDTREMWITKNEDTGEITLQPKPAPDALKAFLAELKAMPTTEDFIPPRDDAPRSSPFEDWAE